MNDEFSKVKNLVFEKTNDTYKVKIDYYRTLDDKRTKPNQPIASYGIILYTIESGTPKFLLYQRRDSYEYMDLIRGVWGNEQKFKELFDNISIDERCRLRDYTFDELWDDLWLIHDSGIYLDGYDRAKKKFDSIKEKLPYFLNTKIKRDVEPSWGFPKGKKNINESPLMCALREFKEETNLPIDSLNIWNSKPLIEFYKGTNNKQYCTYYYIAESPTEMQAKKINFEGSIRNESVSEEAAEVKWFTYDEACEKLSIKRQNMLKKILYQLQK